MRTPCFIAGGTLAPARGHTVAEQAKDYRYSTNHQVVIDADTGLVVVIARPLHANRDDYTAWELSGAADAVGRSTFIAEGGPGGTGLVTPRRRECRQAGLTAWKREHRAVRDCRLRGAGVHHVVLGIVRSPDSTTAPWPGGGGTRRTRLERRLCLRSLNDACALVTTVSTSSADR